MANLKVTTLSVDKLTLSTPSLQEIITGNTIAIFFMSGIVVSFALFFKRIEYDQLLRDSYQGYLYEMTWERQEKHFVHCKLDQTDTNGQKVTAFSTPIKSATYSGLTLGTYTCYVSFVKRNGERINNIELFTIDESSRDCPSTKQTVKQINEYILGKGNTPLSWTRDMRVGDLTKSHKSLWQDASAIMGVLLISFIICFRNVWAIIFAKEESWEFDNQSKTFRRRYKTRKSEEEERFSTDSPQVLEYDYNSVTVAYKVTDKNKYIRLIFDSLRERNKVKSFLEKATGLTAKEIVSDD